MNLLFIGDVVGQSGCDFLESRMYKLKREYDIDVTVAKKMTADDNLDLIIDSYKDKANKDIYFPKCWRNVYGNNKKYFGWDY